MLSLSDRLLRLPGRTCPVVGLTDPASCSESLGASGLGEYLLISDALDLEKVISCLILIHKYRIYLHKYVAKSNLTIKLWFVVMYIKNGRLEAVMVNVLGFKLSGPDLSPGHHYVVSLSKTLLYSHNASLQPGEYIK